MGSPSPAPHPARLRQRLFAWMLAQSGESNEPELLKLHEKTLNRDIGDEGDNHLSRLSFHNLVL
jgi:hypothetical protein